MDCKTYHESECSKRILLQLEMPAGVHALAQCLSCASQACVQQFCPITAAYMGVHCCMPDLQCKAKAMQGQQQALLLNFAANQFFTLLSLWKA